MRLERRVHADEGVSAYAAAKGAIVRRPGFNSICDYDQTKSYAAEHGRYICGWMMDGPYAAQNSSAYAAGCKRTHAAES